MKQNKKSNAEENIISEVEETTEERYCKKCGKLLPSTDEHKYCDNCRRKRIETVKKIGTTVGAVCLTVVSLIPGFNNLNKKE